VARARTAVDGSVGQETIDRRDLVVDRERRRPVAAVIRESHEDIFGATETGAVLVDEVDASA
jgi:hypothetical protein